jgi:hypothetical protein
MQETNAWNAKLARALQSHGYDLKSEDTVDEICARTGLSKTDVVNVLIGSDQCTVKALTTIAQMINVPPAELLNSTKNLVRVYSVDGGSPVVVAIPRDLPEVSAKIGGGGSLLYARNLDGSYFGLHEDTVAICSRDMGKPVVDALYLLESDTARFVRRCISVQAGKHEATMSDDGGTNASYTIVRYSGPHSVSAASPVILGAVLFSFREH